MGWFFTRLGEGVGWELRGPFSSCSLARTQTTVPSLYCTYTDLRYTAGVASAFRRDGTAVDISGLLSACRRRVVYTHIQRAAIHGALQDVWKPRADDANKRVSGLAVSFVEDQVHEAVVASE